MTNYDKEPIDEETFLEGIFSFGVALFAAIGVIISVTFLFKVMTGIGGGIIGIMTSL